MLPKIEVRFEHLNVEADVYIGSRALPSLPNFSLTLIEVRNRELTSQLILWHELFQTAIEE